VYGHVNRHEGLIRLTSAKDVGTTFRILLPRLSEFHTGNLHVNPAPAPLTLPKMVSAVIVDDQVQVLQFVQSVFQANQWTAHCFLSASEALEFLSEAPAVDCLVMDLMMPGVDGAAMLEELEQRRLNLPVVLMSGFFEKNMSELFRFRGVSSLLDKPFRPADLVKAINAAVIRQHSSAAKTLQRDA
jgi:FixJ family two-component response regulator